MTEQLREIRLYGRLGKRFGRIHRLAVESAQEAVMALCVVLDGFERALMEHAGGYLVFAGTKTKAGLLSERTIGVRLADSEAVFIVPVVQGANFWSEALDVVTDTVSSVTMLGWINTPIAGAAMNAIMPKMPSVQQQPDRPEDIPSFAFGSIANYTEQGSAVPIVYGEVIAGSVVASQGLSAVELVI